MLIGALIHLTAVPPFVAYNLAIATIFALVASAAFGVAISLVMGPAAATRADRGAIVAGVASVGLASWGTWTAGCNCWRTLEARRDRPGERHPGTDG